MAAFEVVYRATADIACLPALQYLHISLGAFTEVFWGFFGLYCHEDGTLRYYGSPDQKLDVTTYQDTVRGTRLGVQAACRRATCGG